MLQEYAQHQSQALQSQPEAPSAPTPSTGISRQGSSQEENEYRSGSKRRRVQATRTRELAASAMPAQDFAATLASSKLQGSEQQPDHILQLAQGTHADPVVIASSDESVSDPDTDPNSDDLESGLDEPTTPNWPEGLDRDVRPGDNEATDDGDEAEVSNRLPRASHASAGPKRKRKDTGEGINYATVATVGLVAAREMAARLKARGAPTSTAKTSKYVTIGFYRRSTVPKEGEHAVIKEHAVMGFIDRADRLRARVCPVNLPRERFGDAWPSFTTNGGPWVGFEDIRLLQHLSSLGQEQVKEYVRIRANVPDENDLDAKHRAQQEAVKNAIRAVRHKKGQQQSTSDDLSGNRPRRIFLGTWNKSDAVDLASRHAVYGILGANKWFRIQLVRETRDGTSRDGNFPAGSGALWINFTEVDLDPHLKSLTFAEVKKYCHVRQHQIGSGEKPDERIAHETSAVSEAQQRVSGPRSPFADPATEAAAATTSGDVSGTPEPHPTSYGKAPIPAGQELRTSGFVGARPPHQLQPGRLERQQDHLRDIQREQERLASERATRLSRSVTRNGNPHDPLQRVAALAQRDIGRVEAAQDRADLHAIHHKRAVAAAEQAAQQASLAAAASSPSAPALRSSRLMRSVNNVRATQKSIRARNDGEDTTVYDGVKYERKKTGSLIGKLVSHGSLINIDGEEYVQYLVLAQPSFF